MAEGFHPPLEEYLEAIHELGEEGIVVIQARLAERLGHSAPAISEMIRRLRDEGYVEVRGRSLLLTDRGRGVAESVVRKHRLAERLLTDIIGLPVGEGPRGSGPVGARHLRRGGGSPDRDPGASHHVPARQPDPGRRATGSRMLTALSESRRGDHVRLERVTEQMEIDLDSLAYLSSHGFMPGTEATVSSRAPDGTLILDLGRWHHRPRTGAGPAAVRHRGVEGYAEPAWARLGNMYGPDATFVGVPAADLAEPESFAGAAAVIIGAPYDGGTSHRPGARFGPQAIRLTDYLPHDGSRPHLALGVDPLRGTRRGRRRRRRDAARRRSRRRWPGWKRPCCRSRPPGRCRSSWAATTPSPGRT